MIVIAVSPPDNRLIEESYQQEMAEKRMSEMGEMGEKAYEEEDGSREVTRPRTRRRPASYIEPGQYSWSFHD